MSLPAPPAPPPLASGCDLSLRHSQTGFHTTQRERWHRPISPRGWALYAPLQHANKRVVSLPVFISAMVVEIVMLANKSISVRF